MLLQHFCFFLSQKLYLYPSDCCAPSTFSITDGSSKRVLYYDPTAKYHTSEFAIFAAIAVCVLVIFIICPTILLILYPTRLFRRCVSCCGFWRWYALHMFVESFQGHAQYKDGTNGTCDFRMVSASFLIYKLGSFGNCHYSHISSMVQCILFGCALSFYAVVRSYTGILAAKLIF